MRSLWCTSIGLIGSYGSLSSRNEMMGAEELENLAINEATIEILSCNSKEIIGQYTYYFFDVLTNTAKILVYTDYYLIGTDGAMGRHLLIVPIYCFEYGLMLFNANVTALCN